MNCSYELCIYEKNGKCTLNSISINTLGMCHECINANIPKRILETLKIRQLEKYEEYIDIYLK